MPLYGASPVHAPDLPRGRTALWLVAFAAMHPKNKLSDSGVEAAAHRVMFHKATASTSRCKHRAVRDFRLFGPRLEQL